MKNLTLKTKETKGILNLGVTLFEGIDGEEGPILDFSQGQEVFVIGSYSSELYTSGKAVIVSDGNEVCSIDSTLITILEGGE